MRQVVLRTLLAATIASLTLPLADIDPARAQTPVSSCEQVVEGDGYLTGDLDCGPNTEAGVEIRSGGSLDMRGFGIHGGEYGVLCADEGRIISFMDVFRYTPCRVFGGGTIG